MNVAIVVGPKSRIPRRKVDEAKFWKSDSHDLEFMYLTGLYDNTYPEMTKKTDTIAMPCMNMRIIGN